jgi:signal peptidase I
MHLDFAAILVALTLTTGIIWAIDAIFFARRRVLVGASGPEPVEDARLKPKEPLIVEYARSFFPVILIVLLIRSFLAEPFRIPSSSMVPTLLVGDLILVSKFAYGIRLPVLDTKLIPMGEPARGDVVVFRYPEDPSLDYIKRVIGVPGDVIEYRNKTVFLNGAVLTTEVLGPFTKTDGERMLSGQLLGVEYIGSVEHEILINPASYDPRFQGRKWIVPEGEYFVLGDNRDNSRDSRFWGFVPEDHLVGKAFLVWMHLSPSGWGRIGTMIN